MKKYTKPMANVIDIALTEMLATSQIGYDANETTTDNFVREDENPSLWHSNSDEMW